MPGNCLLETTLVLRILGRQPSFWVPTVLFPAMLYTFFGAGLAGAAPQRAMPWLPSPFMRCSGSASTSSGLSVAQDVPTPLHHLANAFYRVRPFAPWVARVGG